MIETEVKYLINKLPINLPNPMYIEQRYFEPVNTLNKREMQRKYCISFLFALQ